MKTKLPKLEDFLEELQRSWKEAKKLIEVVKKAIKKQFDRKRYNLQVLQTQILRVGQVNESCIGLIQKCYNSKTLEWISEEKPYIRVEYKRTQ